MILINCLVSFCSSSIFNINLLAQFSSFCRLLRSVEAPRAVCGRRRCNTDGCFFDDHFCHLDCSSLSFSSCSGCLDSKLCTDKCTVDTCRQLPSCLLFGFLSANNRSAVPKTDCIFIHALFFRMTYFCHWFQVFTRCTVYLSVLLPAGICLAMMLLSTGKKDQNQTHNQGSAFKIPI